MSLVPPPKVEKLQGALHTKAKGSSSYRFYALYDKIYRKDVLQHAFLCCLANQGVAGVDGVTFEQIEELDEGIRVGSSASIRAFACPISSPWHQPGTEG